MKKMLVFLLLLTSVAFAADKYDTWLNEQVKPIITKEERDAFKKLKTDAEKDKFITDFWAKRDPSPGTPENEYQKNYEAQLQILVDKLKGSDKKAVDTDMGMTALILGGGYEVTQEGDKDSPKQTWTYHHLPPGLASGDVIIKFEGDQEEGGFVFANSKDAHKALDTARDYYAHLAEKASGMQAEEKAKMEATMAAAEAMPAVSTPEVKAALDAAAGGKLATDVPVTGIADSFMTSTGDVFATFAASSSADMSSARVGVRIANGDGSALKEGEYAFANPEEAPGHFQAGTPIKPGNYTVYIAVVAGGKSGSVKAPLNVPDFAAGFSASSLILAKDFKQLTEAKPEKEPYTFGKIKVTPSTERTFTKSDNLIVVYEAYNFDMPAGATAPNLEVVFTFQHESDPPKSTPPAPPNGLLTGKKFTVPTSYPLEKFPPGTYKLTVKVTDKASGKTASQEASYTVK